MKRPEKIPNLMKTIKECIELDLYFDTSHAKKRQFEREIDLSLMLYVLRNGYHEKKKDEFKPEYGRWMYAVRGCTVEGRDIRIIVAFEGKKMVIVTVIDIKRSPK